MKTEKILIIFAIIIALGVVIVLGTVGNEIEEVSPDYIVDELDFLSDDLIDDISSSDVSAGEEAGLIMMREEEKLARDVYLALGDLWGMNIFYNIAESEQTHTDSVKTLLDRYDISDPVINDDVGVFAAQEFTDLYNSLFEQGSRSIEDALIVGATIEDLDIFDLEELLAETDNEDIIKVYENLLRGSENHMRAFSSQLDSRGASYEAQFLSQEQINDILQK